MLAKDPKRRKSPSGSRARRNGVRSDATFEQSFSPSRAADPRLGGHFVLYVEGARDREILECWARRVDPGLARCIERNTVILGGRRPARALVDFQKRGGVAAGYSGLIVLDRDDQLHEESTDAGFAELESVSLLSAERSDHNQPDGGLEVFVWSLRHIESYLLVPAAIGRMLRLGKNDRTVERFIEINSTDDARAIGANEAWKQSVGDVATGVRGSLHAKRVLGAGGSLSEALGTDLRAGDIARAMRIEDLHRDVRSLFDRIGKLSGLRVKSPEVVIRPS